MTKLAPAQDFIAMVRARDYARFLAIQLAPADRRRALYAVTALAGELARIPAQVREPLAGFMRYAWWREQLENMQQGAAAPMGHPLLQEIADVLAPPHYAALPDLIAAWQYALESPEDEACRARADRALNNCWRALLDETGEHEPLPLRALARLPTQGRIGPWHIVRLIGFAVRADKNK